MKTEIREVGVWAKIHICVANFTSNNPYSVGYWSWITCFWTTKLPNTKNREEKQYSSNTTWNCDDFIWTLNAVQIKLSDQQRHTDWIISNRSLIISRLYSILFSTRRQLTHIHTNAVGEYVNLLVRILHFANIRRSTVKPLLTAFLFWFYLRFDRRVSGEIECMRSTVYMCARSQVYRWWCEWQKNPKRKHWTACDMWFVWETFSFGL